MRHRIASLLTVCLMITGAACPPKPDSKTPGGTPGAGPGASGSGQTPARTAGERPAPAMDRLDGHDVEQSSEGAWRVRRTGGAKEAMGDVAYEATALGDDGASSRKRMMTGAAPPTPEAAFESRGVGSPADPALAPPLPPPASLESAGPGGALMRHLPPMAAQLKAGSTDDNVEFDAFLEFLATYSDRPDTASQVQLLDVRDRRTVEIVDDHGRALPGVAIDIYDAESEKPLGSATSYGDGKAPFYPKLLDPRSESRRWLVNARLGERHVSATFERDAPSLRLEFPAGTSDVSGVPLDVVFLIDTTGSMSDEIQRIKETLLSVTQKTRNAGANVDLRYAAVLYRDVGDEYLTRTHPFTSDIAAFDQALQSVGAGGGGDGPESLNQGLAEAIHGVQWRERAARVVFLIADAPPHMDYEGDVPYGESAKDAVARGIRVHAVAASGLDPMGTLCFRQVAQFTRGRFIFIEYGSVAASAAAHGVKGEVKSNNLDDIVFEQLVREIDEYAVAAR